MPTAFSYSIPSVAPRHRTTPTCAANPPRRIAAVAKDLKQALQTSLSERTSRIDIVLPAGAKLGTEKRPADEDPRARIRAGDRELGRILAGMFECTGLRVRVIFPTAAECHAATDMWGPLVECEIHCLDPKRKKQQTSKNKNRSGFGSRSSSSSGGNRPTSTSDHVDVFIFVGGGAAFLQRARALADDVGMDKLIILANANSNRDQLPLDLDKYRISEFEGVYHYYPNPHPKWSGGVLFRKFPDGMCKIESFGATLNTSGFISGQLPLTLLHFVSCFSQIGSYAD